MKNKNAVGREDVYAGMKEQMRAAGRRTLIFVKWLAFAVLIGLLVGLVGVAFGKGVVWANAFRQAHPWVLWLLPAAGVVIALIYQLTKLGRAGSTNFVLVSVRENANLPLRTAPVIFASTILTHLAGGSAGREGAALQLGGSISAAVGRAFRIGEKDSPIMTMCGMAAAFSALFGTPLTAAVFAMEVTSVGVMYYASLVPCVLSSLVGAWLARHLGQSPIAFVLSGVPELSPLSLLQTAGLGVLLALLSILFCQTMHAAAHLSEKAVRQPLLRAAVGGALVLAATLLLGTQDYNGAGSAVIAAAVAGQAVPYAFLLKILFTAVTLGTGFRGGEIVPVLFVGSTFGCAAAPLLGLSPSFGAGLGMVSLFCGVTNCPMTSLLLAVEVFGGAGLPLFGLSCAVSYMLSGYTGLYSEQKILYSKFKAEFINKKAD